MVKNIKKHQASFKKNRFAVVDDFLTGEALTVYQNYVIDKIQAGHWNLGDPQVSTRYSIHNEPFIRYVHEALTAKMEAITGYELLPVYAFTIGYLQGSVLPRHRDRPACEISATLTLYGNGDTYPIYVDAPAQDDSEKEDCECIAHEMEGYPDFYKPEDADPALKHMSEHPLANFPNPTRGVPVCLNPGEALIYEGQNINHWRNELKEEEGFCSLLLHYVKKQGVHRSEYLMEGNHGWLRERDLFVPVVQTASEQQQGVETQVNSEYNTQDTTLLENMGVTNERHYTEGF
tara:strand:+ start:69 stop:938 length:870 start_codon:yes stop_codon:yes gene_type:complete